MRQAEVYIILVNYNGYEDTKACVNSLKKINYDNFHIVIVENASKDVQIMKTDLFLNENATILFSEKNDGFSSGNNIGIKYALENNADYILLLNNDTVVDCDFLKHLVELMENNTKAGIVTGDIYYYKDQERLWYSNGKYDRKNGTTQMCCKTAELSLKVSFACGCLMLLNVEMIKQIGMLEDLFFLYSEDTEYCCRAIDSGWDILWTKKCKIYHKISASTGENSDFQQYYLTRNNLILAKKYGNRPVVCYMKTLWRCIKDIIKKRCHIGPVRAAYVDFFRGVSGKTGRY